MKVRTLAASPGRLLAGLLALSAAILLLAGLARAASIVAWCDPPGYHRGVFIDGTYAYLAAGNEGLQVVDITDPTDMDVVGAAELPGAPGWAYDVVVSDTYAYVAHGNRGLQIVDISDLDNMEVVGSYATWGKATGLTLDETTGYIIIAHGWGGMSIIDVTDPEDPTLVERVPSNGGPALDVASDGAYAYLADGYSGLTIIAYDAPEDDPDDPEEEIYRDAVVDANAAAVGSVHTTNATGVFLNGNYAYVADGDGRLRIIDITDPEDPIKVERSGAGFCQSVFVDGTTAYVAVASETGSQSRLLVIDITDPTAPSLTQSLDTTGGIRHGKSYDVKVDGAYAYIAAGGAGLLVVSIP